LSKAGHVVDHVDLVVACDVVTSEVALGLINETFGDREDHVFVGCDGCKYCRVVAFRGQSPDVATFTKGPERLTTSAAEEMRFPARAREEHEDRESY